jgi:hypothetical protein
MNDNQSEIKIINRGLHNRIYDPQTGGFKARKRLYTVWIVSSRDPGLKMYHCPDCRNPIAQYKGEAVMEVPGLFPSPLPVIIQCKNVNCGRKVMFQAVVTQELI